MSRQSLHQQCLITAADGLTNNGLLGPLTYCIWALSTVWLQGQHAQQGNSATTKTSAHSCPTRYTLLYRWKQTTVPRDQKLAQQGWRQQANPNSSITPIGHGNNSLAWISERCRSMPRAAIRPIACTFTASLEDSSEHSIRYTQE
jgi:hypothetical protein